MKVFIIALYTVFVSAYCASMFDEQLNNQWSIFKQTYKKQYQSIDEEIIR
jgi:hypothetical protein